MPVLYRSSGAYCINLNIHLMNPTFTLSGRRMALLCLLTTLIFTTRLAAQDVSITITSQRGGINENTWPFGATDCTVLMTVCNNDGGSAPVPEYKLRPMLCVGGGGFLQIAPDAQQTGLPAGWSILSNDGDSIRLSNGTDTWLPGECREISIKIITFGLGGPDLFSGILDFADGSAPGDTPGSPTVDNDPNNDYAEATAMVVNTLPAPIQFNAVREQETALLNWTAQGAAPGDWFEVEYSRNGQSWRRLALLPASSGGASPAYSYRHTGIDGGLHYYRIKITAHTGGISYSPVRLLRAVAGGNSFVYPNPAANRLHITVQQAATASINTITGMRVSALRLQPGTNTIDISGLEPGVYLVAVQRPGAAAELHRIVVQQ